MQDSRIQRIHRIPRKCWFREGSSRLHSLCKFPVGYRKGISGFTGYTFSRIPDFTGFSVGQGEKTQGSLVSEITRIYWFQGFRGFQGFTSFRVQQVQQVQQDKKENQISRSWWSSRAQEVEWEGNGNQSKNRLNGGSYIWNDDTSVSINSASKRIYLLQ